MTPNLLSLYDAPPPEDPRDIVEQASSAPTADAVLDKYIAAVGGAARAASLTSATAKGSSVGYGPDSDQRPVEIYAKPRINVRRSCIRRAATARRPSMAVRDGSQPRSVPCPVLAVAGADLDGLRLDAELSFPARIREVADRWRVGQQIAIDGRDGAGAPAAVA